MRNHGVRKVCGCGRQRWGRCPHSWYVNFCYRREHFRLSIDKHVGRHIGPREEAVDVFADIRKAIKAGTFRQDPAPPAIAPVNTPTAYTLETFGNLWHKRYAQVRKPGSATSDAAMLARVCAFQTENVGRFGDKSIGAITEDDIEVFLDHLRTIGRAASTRNHYFQLFRSLSAWGLKKGYLTRAWFGASSDLKRDAVNRRHRRLAGDEEVKLLAAAPPHLYRLLVAALETGCRRGELLQLRRRDVDLDRREIRLEAATTKAKRLRMIPILARLLAVLQMAVLDAAGRELKPTAFVLGHGTGARLKTVKRAWETAVLKSHGHTPQWLTGGKLSPESRGVLRAIDLHFHDLRHEAGSRWLEAGWPLHHVRAVLGHADVKTTDTYLNATIVGLHESMRRFDEQAGKSCNDVANSSDPGVADSRTDVRNSDQNGLIH